MKTTNKRPEPSTISFASAIASMPASYRDAYHEEYERQKATVGMAYLAYFFLGWLGVHKFYLGEYFWGLVYLVCIFVGGAFPPAFAILFFGLFFDLFLVPSQVSEANDNTRRKILTDLLTEISNNC